MTEFFLTVALSALLGGLIIGYTLKNGISPMPTSSKVRQALFDHLPPLRKGVVVDLGSGWGHLLFPLSKYYPECTVIGYENSLLPYLFSTCLNRYRHVRVMRRNFFHVSLSEASLVVCYLFPKGMEKLKTKLESELASGALVVTHTFAIPGWKPIKTVHVGDLYRSPIYFYRMGKPCTQDKKD